MSQKSIIREKLSNRKRRYNIQYNVVFWLWSADYWWYDWIHGWHNRTKSHVDVLCARILLHQRVSDTPSAIQISFLLQASSIKSKRLGVASGVNLAWCSGGVFLTGRNMPQQYRRYRLKLITIAAKKYSKCTRHSRRHFSERDESNTEKSHRTWWRSTHTGIVTFVRRSKAL
jgi:hypothetical protein